VVHRRFRRLALEIGVAACADWVDLACVTGKRMNDARRVALSSFRYLTVDRLEIENQRVVEEEEEEPSGEVAVLLAQGNMDSPLLALEMVSGDNRGEVHHKMVASIGEDNPLEPFDA
jgi:hypothetical protein